MSLRWLTSLIIVMSASCFTLTAQDPPAETPAAAALRIRRTDAENRALFQSAETLPITIEANFGSVTRDRDLESTKQFPGRVKIADGDSTVEIPVQISARSHLRRKTCDFLPLQVAFSKPEAKGTVFDMRAAALKLVTHCNATSQYEQFILKEYLAYRLSNIITPRSFRARLAKATYVDATRGKPLLSRYAIFLEDDDDVARRLEGKASDRLKIPFVQLHPVALLQMMIFQFMIGNTDYSIMAQHNIRIVETSVGLTYPIPYDFDITGLVRAPYGIPDPRLHLRDLTHRLYRGPCRTVEQLEPMLNTFRIKKAEMLAAITSVPDLNKFNQGEMTRFLNLFFSMIDKPSSVKRYLIDTCVKGGL